jgi:hypothetical protein
MLLYVDFLGTHMADLVLFFKTGCDRLDYMKKVIEEAYGNWSELE